MIVVFFIFKMSFNIGKPNAYGNVAGQPETIIFRDVSILEEKSFRTHFESHVARRWSLYEETMYKLAKNPDVSDENILWIMKNFGVHSWHQPVWRNEWNRSEVVKKCFGHFITGKFNLIDDLLGVKYDWITIKMKKMVHKLIKYNPPIVDEPNFRTAIEKFPEKEFYVKKYKIRSLLEYSVTEDGLKWFENNIYIFNSLWEMNMSRMI